MSPKLDVLMPVYNREDFVLDALDGLRNQTFKDFNIIIYDDGSTDKTVLNIAKYAKDHGMNNVYVYVGKQNMGVGYARNQLFKYSKAKYCIWQDSDDVSHTQRLEQMVAFIEKGGCDMAFSDLFFYVHPSNYTQTRNRKTIDLSIYTSREGLFNNMNFATGIFKGELRRFLFQPRRKREDIEWLELLIKNNIVFKLHPLGLYFVRRHGGRLTYQPK